MTPAVQFQIGDRATEAIRRLVASRENQDGIGNAMNTAMQYWISFIMAKQTVAGGIRDYLMQRAFRAKGGGSPKMQRTKSGKESTAKRYMAIRHSKAAAIVYATNYKNARSLDSKEFYTLVGKYISRRMYSAGYHKAGFRPALAEFKVRRGAIGAAPAYRKTYSTALAARPVSESIMEALVHNAARGAGANPGGGESAVIQAESEVVAILERFTAKNLLERARRAGLKVRI